MNTPGIQGVNRHVSSDIWFNYCNDMFKIFQLTRCLRSNFKQARNKRESGSAIPRGPHPIFIFRAPHHFRAKNFLSISPYLFSADIFEVSLSLNLAYYILIVEYRRPWPQRENRKNKEKKMFNIYRQTYHPTNTHSQKQVLVALKKKVQIMTKIRFSVMLLLKCFSDKAIK